jgi:predicted dehydrogenase
VEGHSADGHPVPKLAFWGMDWIGRRRLEAILSSGAARVVAVGDPVPEQAAAGARVAAGARAISSFKELLSCGADGLVISTGTPEMGLNAMQALDRQMAVFSQLPVGRSRREVNEVVCSARRANRLMEADHPYRFSDAMQEVSKCVASGELGEIYAVELGYHHAFSPTRPRSSSGELPREGCMMDLGLHLIDLALWSLGFPAVRSVASQLRAGGLRVRGRDASEDYATAQIELERTSVSLTCSYQVPVGCQAQIMATFHGTRGGAGLRNLDGTTYRFVAERYLGATRETIAGHSAGWIGRGTAEWARRLGESACFDPRADQLNRLAGVVDAIYGQN